MAFFRIKDQQQLRYEEYKVEGSRFLVLVVVVVVAKMKTLHCFSAFI